MDTNTDTGRLRGTSSALVTIRHGAFRDTALKRKCLEEASTLALKMALESSLLGRKQKLEACRLFEEDTRTLGIPLPEWAQEFRKPKRDKKPSDQATTLAQGTGDTPVTAESQPYESVQEFHDTLKRLAVEANAYNKVATPDTSSAESKTDPSEYHTLHQFLATDTREDSHENKIKLALQDLMPESMKSKIPFVKLFKVDGKTYAAIGTYRGDIPEGPHAGKQFNLYYTVEPYRSFNTLPSGILVCWPDSDRPVSATHGPKHNTHFLYAIRYEEKREVRFWQLLDSKAGRETPPWGCRVTMENGQLTFRYK